MRVNKQVIQKAKDHAKAQYPKESCGLIIKTSQGRDYYPCNNKAIRNSDFIIDPEDYAKAEDLGEILAVVHSHPDASPQPSMADRVSCSLWGLEWLILSYPDVGEYWLKPDNYQAPLLGREFAHGILDCYTLIKDYYERELAIQLPDFKRDNLWWENKESHSLYEENFENAGFYKVDNLSDYQRHDVIIFQVGRTYHPNHAGIYLGDDPNLTSEETPKVIGKPFFLHHLYGGDSKRDIYGFEWNSRKRYLLRHRDYAN